MAQSKDDITYGTAQARVSDDEALRVAYKHGTPLEAGKIAESEPIDLFQSAHNICKSSATQDSSSQTHNKDHHHEEQRDSNNKEGSSTELVTGAPDLPKKVPPTMAHK